MMEDIITLLKKQLANKSLSARTSEEKTNIEIVEIEEQESIQTQIEAPLKTNN